MSESNEILSKPENEFLTQISMRTPEKRARLLERPSVSKFEMTNSLQLSVWAIRYRDWDQNTGVSREKIPEHTFCRVAEELAYVEKNYRPDISQKELSEVATTFYDVMVQKKFTPAGRTLADLGTGRKVVSNCVVLGIDDKLTEGPRSIMSTLHEAVKLQCQGCGLGFAWHLLRPYGSEVVSGRTQSSGIVSYFNMYASMFATVKQTNSRHGANMGMCLIDHPEVLEFIRAKDKEGGATSVFNITVMLTDEFMRRATDVNHQEFSKPWMGRYQVPARHPSGVGTLRDANGNEVMEEKHERPFFIVNVTDLFKDKNGVPTSTWGKKALQENSFKVGDKYYPGWTASEIMEHIAKHAWSNGEPGFCFYDQVQRTNPLPGLGPIQASNPCVTGDTWVMTEEGPRQVVDLLDAPFTAIVDGKSYEATAFFPTGTKKVYELRTSNGYRVKATSNHQIAVRDKREWVQLGDLVEGDEVILSKHSPRTEWKGKGTSEEGYALGSLLGDGTIGPLQGDKCPAPEVFHSSSSEFQKAFISGLFDADGTFTGSKEKGCSVRLWQHDLRVLDIVQKSLSRFGIVSTIYENRKIAGEKLMPDGKGGSKFYKVTAGHELVISRSSMVLFNEIIGFVNSNKREKLQSYISGLQKTPYASRYYAKVDEIVELDEEPTYDCTVDQVHAFDANGIKVHNCGEQFLHDGDVCNLGALNIYAFCVRAANGGASSFDWDELKRVSRVALQMLENVIDVTEFDSYRVQSRIRENRRVGLGIMGFADACYALRIRYGSKKAVKFAKRVMRTITHEARAKSVELAKQRGSFPNIHLSVFAGKTEMRNAACTTIAPTGTIAAVNGVYGGCEPCFAPAYSYRNVLQIGEDKRPLVEEAMRECCRNSTIPEMRNMAEAIDHELRVGPHQEFVLWMAEIGINVHSPLRWLAEDILGEEEAAKWMEKNILPLGITPLTSLYNGIMQMSSFKPFSRLIPFEIMRVFVTAQEISVEEHIKMQAAFQDETDNSISKTQNLPNEATLSDIVNTIVKSWIAGLKGCTVYRDGSRQEQVLNLNTSSALVKEDCENGEHKSVGRIRFQDFIENSSADDYRTLFAGAKGGMISVDMTADELQRSLRFSISQNQRRNESKAQRDFKKQMKAFDEGLRGVCFTERGDDDSADNSSEDDRTVIASSSSSSSSPSLILLSPPHQLGGRPLKMSMDGTSMCTRLGCGE